MVEEEFSKEEKAWIRMAANQIGHREFDTDRAWEKVKGRQCEDRTLKRRWTLGWVAAVVFLCSTGVTLWLMSDSKDLSLAGQTSVAVTDGVPELILAGGERVLLDGTQVPEKMEQPGAIAVVDSASQQLQYQENEREMDSLVYNQLKTPKGCTYSLVLSDGTKVHLNAESSLKFPVKFTQGFREVHLDGEAYFEVTPDKTKPFLVKTGQRVVQVLGTSFNVCAYHLENSWHTTLVSGKVKVTAEKQTFLLFPNEQYLENVATGEREVRCVDPQEFISWRSGMIRFRSERLEDIILKLSHWYDFQIFYASDELKDMRFRGTIRKTDPFDVVFRNLEQTTAIHFEINGNTVIARKVYSK